MLSNELWKELCKAQSHLGNEIGVIFFHKELKENVKITHYTLSGQLFFENKEKNIRGCIWDEEYFKTYKEAKTC